MYKVTVNKKEFRAEFDRNKMEISGKKFEADILEYKEGKFHILRDNKSISAELVEMNLEEKTFLIKVNSNIYSVIVRDKYDELLKSLGMDSLNSSKVNEVKAPMPGLVLDIRVSEGDEVKKGDPILVLEAMKMENIIKSPTDGVIKKINVKKGLAVEKNQVLINFA